jgi:hypothetical protein
MVLFIASSGFSRKYLCGMGRRTGSEEKDERLSIGAGSTAVISDEISYSSMPNNRKILSLTACWEIMCGR